MNNGLYERFHAGEVLHVQSSQGTRFYAKPECWEGFLLGYSILDESGATVPGYHRKQMDTKDIQLWLAELKEVEMETNEEKAPVSVRVATLKCSVCHQELLDRLTEEELLQLADGLRCPYCETMLRLPSLNPFTGKRW